MFCFGLLSLAVVSCCLYICLSCSAVAPSFALYSLVLSGCIRLYGCYSVSALESLISALFGPFGCLLLSVIVCNLPFKAVFRLSVAFSFRLWVCTSVVVLFACRANLAVFICAVGCLRGLLYFYSLL